MKARKIINPKTNPNNAVVLYRTREPRMRNEYFKWLYELAFDRNQNYTSLAHKLHTLRFSYQEHYVPLDDNREADGIKLREEFLEAFRYKDKLINGECSMLEMMIALARRCDDVTTSGDHPQISKWFLLLLHNVGLDNYSNYYYEHNDGAKKVEDIINVILTRSYDRLGHGSFFPVKDIAKKMDMRKTEIWYQMCIYINENFYQDEN